MALVFFTGGYAQNKEEAKVAKNTLGLSARKFVNVLFKESDQGSDFIYIRGIGNGYALRAGALLSFSSGENDYNEFGVSLGAHKLFKQQDRWSFYYGADAMFEVNYQTQGTREQYVASLLPFLGVRFALGKHVSLSTEPGLFVNYQHTRDSESFLSFKDVIRGGLFNLGYLRLDIHF